MNTVKSSPVCRLPVFIEEMEVEAVVDTAAQVTVVSDKVINRLQSPVPTIKQMIINTAKRGQKMLGLLFGPVQLKFGSQQFLEEIYVAPVVEEMLLGMDFLTKHGEEINIPKAYVKLGAEKISIRESNEMKLPEVSGVMGAKTEEVDYVVLPTFNRKHKSNDSSSAVWDPGIAEISGSTAILD